MMRRRVITTCSRPDSSLSIPLAAASSGGSPTPGDREDDRVGARTARPVRAASPLPPSTARAADIPSGVSSDPSSRRCRLAARRTRSPPPSADPLAARRGCQHQPHLQCYPRSPDSCSPGHARRACRHPAQGAADAEKIAFAWRQRWPVRRPVTTIELKDACCRAAKDAAWQREVERSAAHPRAARHVTRRRCSSGVLRSVS